MKTKFTLILVICFYAAEAQNTPLDSYLVARSNIKYTLGKAYIDSAPVLGFSSDPKIVTIASSLIGENSVSSNTLFASDGVWKDFFKTSSYSNNPLSSALFNNSNISNLKISVDGDKTFISYDKPYSSVETLFYIDKNSNFYTKTVSNENWPSQYITSLLSTSNNANTSDGSLYWLANNIDKEKLPTIDFASTISLNKWAIANYQSSVTTLYNTDGSANKIRFDDHTVTLWSGKSFTPTSTEASQYIIPTQSTSKNNGISISHNAIYKETFSGTDGITWASINAATQNAGTNITLFTGTNNTNNTSGSYDLLNYKDRSVFSVGIDKAGDGYIGWKDANDKAIEIKAAQILSQASLWLTGSVNTEDRLSVRGMDQWITSITPTELNWTDFKVSGTIGFNVEKKYPYYNANSLFLRTRNSTGIDMDVNSVTMIRITNEAIVAGDFNEVLAYQTNASTAFKIASKKGGLGYPTMTADEIARIKNPAIGDAIFDLTNDRLIVRGLKGWQVSSFYPTQ